MWRRACNATSNATRRWNNAYHVVAPSATSLRRILSAFMSKLTDFVGGKTQLVKGLKNAGQLQNAFTYASQFYKK